jgi:hypothetical protein
MLNKNEKKQIINRLNTMFNSKEQLIALCNVLSNDIDKIMQVISKIIKYSFVKGYLHDGETLCSLIYHPDYVDEKYKEYLNINSKKYKDTGNPYMDNEAWVESPDDKEINNIKRVIEIMQEQLKELQQQKKNF